jgi:hypothetical protein
MIVVAIIGKDTKRAYMESAQFVVGTGDIQITEPPASTDRGSSGG